MVWQIQKQNQDLSILGYKQRSCKNLNPKLFRIEIKRYLKFDNYFSSLSKKAGKHGWCEWGYLISRDNLNESIYWIAVWILHSCLDVSWWGCQRKNKSSSITTHCQKVEMLY